MNHELEKTAHSHYLDWITSLAMQVPNAVDHAESTRQYLYRMNLIDEFDGLEDKAVIYDVGCANGGATIGLQFLCPEFQFVGIDCVQPTVESNLEQFRFVKESADQLSKVSLKLPEDLYPPQVILLRNVLNLMTLYEERFGGKGIVRDTLAEISQLLPTGGKALIYDAPIVGRGYDYYAEIIEDAGIGLSAARFPTMYRSFHPEENINYLRLQK